LRASSRVCWILLDKYYVLSTSKKIIQVKNELISNSWHNSLAKSISNLHQESLERNKIMLRSSFHLLKTYVRNHSLFFYFFSTLPPGLATHERIFLRGEVSFAKFLFLQIFLVLAKSDGCRLMLPNRWRCSSSHFPYILSTRMDQEQEDVWAPEHDDWIRCSAWTILAWCSRLLATRVKQIEEPCMHMCAFFSIDIFLPLSFSLLFPSRLQFFSKKSSSTHHHLWPRVTSWHCQSHQFWMLTDLEGSLGISSLDCWIKIQTVKRNQLTWEQNTSQLFC
jgi:hypothetical protein